MPKPKTLSGAAVNNRSSVFAENGSAAAAAGKKKKDSRHPSRPIFANVHENRRRSTRNSRNQQQPLAVELPIAADEENLPRLNNNARSSVRPSLAVELIAPPEEESKKPAPPRRSARLSTIRQQQEEQNAAEEERKQQQEEAKILRRKSAPVLKRASRSKVALPKRKSAPPAQKSTRGNSHGPSKKPNRKRARSRSRDDTKSSPERKTKRARTKPARGTEAVNLPVVSQPHHNLPVAPFDPSIYTSGISVYDASFQEKVLYVPEYASDILQRLFHSETKYQPKRYTHTKPDITAQMRTILVDWMVEVHWKNSMVSETLHLAVNILDRYLARVQVSRDGLQLVGITCLLLAAKYEEIYPPEVKDCVEVTGQAYTKQNVLDTEADILAELDFSLSVPTGHPFLQRFLLITKATRTMRSAATYYIERVLQEEASLDFRPSEIAAAAVCLAINHPEIREHDELDEEQTPGLPQEIVTYTGFSAAQIYRAAEFVARSVGCTYTTTRRKKLVNVQKKFSGTRYNKISEDFAPPDAIDIFEDVPSSQDSTTDL